MATSTAASYDASNDAASTALVIQPRLPPMFRTRLTEMLGIDHPIMLAGMGGVSLARLAAAVSNAGGFGCLGALMGAASLRNELREVKKLTKGPFGVDILAGTPQLVESVRVLIEEGGKVFVTGRGTSPEVIDMCHKGGLKVGCVAGAVKHAVNAVKMGYDFVIIQGTEAGGHTGDVSLFPLLPQVLDAVGAQVPVVAAGGIYDGRGLAAALAMGADGVWVGTRFLATPEAVTVPGFKEKLLQTTSRDTVITEAYTGKPCRVIKNDFTAKVISSGVNQKEYYQKMTREEMLKINHLYRPDRPGADMNVEFMPCGQVIGAIKAIEPAHLVFNRMLLGAREQLDRANRARL